MQSSYFGGAVKSFSTNEGAVHLCTPTNSSSGGAVGRLVFVVRLLFKGGKSVAISESCLRQGEQKKS